MQRNISNSKSNRVTYFLMFLSILFTLFFLPNFAKAASIPLSGYAWSSNIGWISFSGTGYGVTVDDTNGRFSGYAWSSNIGWIKFGGLSSCPGSASCIARVNLNNGRFSGWARACAGTASGDCATMNSRTDGWDGWISLSCYNTNTCSGSDYRWQLSGADVNGYAWGGNVVGWVDASSVVIDLDLPTAVLEARVLGSGNSFLSTSPFSISSGEDIELEWASTDATSCVGTVSGDPAAGGFSIGGVTSGIIGAPLTEPSDGTSATYTVICDNFVGSASASIVVNAMSTEIFLTAAPQVVDLVDTVTLTWDVGGNSPASCTVTGPNGYSLNLGGYMATDSVSGIVIDGESDFSLTCVSNGINPGATSKAKVQISGDFSEG